MRPLRIEIEGIGSFRQRADLDLHGVDLFALAGPTGAGKTTLLVDAMMLALYGTIPRYDDRRLVAPAISQGANEGRVRLTFSVGARTFTATRVVRRTKQGGATTKEARLEDVTDGGSVSLAGNADEVTGMVGRLLGLDFDQFCRSVVLPQGAFDRFLFAKPAERADLLVTLLDLGLHEEVGKRARALAQAQSARAESADRRLQGELANATTEALEAAAVRVDTLTDLATQCTTAQDELDRLREDGAALAERAKQADADLHALQGLQVPTDLDQLHTEAAEVAQLRQRAEERRDAAGRRLEAAEAAHEAAPVAATLEELARRRDEVAALDRGRTDLAAAVDAARDDVGTATAAVEVAADALARARDHLDAARRGELVHALTADLSPGDPCPVCATTLTSLPDADAAETTAAQTALEAADRQHHEADATRRRTENALAAAEANAATQAGRLEETEVALVRLGDETGLRDDDALADAQERRRTADQELAAARSEEREARQAVAAAGAAAEEHARRQNAAWQAFDTARDAVARFGPPPADRHDLAGAWEALGSWAEGATPNAERAAGDLAVAVDDARRRWKEADGDLRRACAAAGVDVPSGTVPGVAVAGALATARERRQAIADRLEQLAAVTAERDAARDEAKVADHLGKLLRADGFERWLLNRAMRQLVTGASDLLRELSSGAYSLALDGTNQFLVVDHRNADEPRTVRSLSGGERFLASLALALALADHVADLAADGAAKLESLFLDEGFGTLDPDTLDVVAAALEELGARGRVVGIITHVRDLAERLPVRFEVRKGPAGSSVVRTDADDAATGDGGADGEDGGRIAADDAGGGTDGAGADDDGREDVA